MKSGRAHLSRSKIGSAVMVRADFHPVEEDFDHVINIHPQMAFGTGHHETTVLMMEWLLLEQPKERDVLDLGCGTGVLAILASKLGANKVHAMDNDPIAVTSTKENLEKNNTANVSVAEGDADISSRGGCRCPAG